MQLRPYQQARKDAANEFWQRMPKGYVLVVLPTGAGKTVFFADIIASEQGAVCAIAHRQELVGQMSLTLARNGVFHRVVGPDSVVKGIVRLHMQVLGKSYYNPESRVAVAGVDTLIRRGDTLHNWMQTVGLVVVDEAHHVLKENKWGKACQMFPNAKGLCVTATPIRADGNGLGRTSDGLVDELHEGPGMRDLINDGYLTEYKIYAPPSDFNRDALPVSDSTGDFNIPKMRQAVAESSLVSPHDGKSVMGDIVSHYLKLAPGKLGITFVSDLTVADEVCAQFNAAGVPASVISSKMKDSERFTVLQKFASRQILQLVNVDILGEGFDCPAAEVVSFGRPTESFSLYSQQFGRVLRLAEGKQFAIIIDHVGNVMRHRGPPDIPRVWTLDRAEKRRSSASEPLTTRVCTVCSLSFERFLDTCPDCGTPVPPPASKGTPEQVDGDLTELDPQVLAQLRREAEIAMMDAGDYRDRQIARGVPAIGVISQVKKHIARKESLTELQDEMTNWLGYQIGHGLSQREQYKKFYQTFGIDWESARSLKKDEADKLKERVLNVTNN